MNVEQYKGQGTVSLKIAILSLIIADQSSLCEYINTSIYGSRNCVLVDCNVPLRSDLMDHHPEDEDVHECQVYEFSMPTDIQCKCWPLGILK